MLFERCQGDNSSADLNENKSGTAIMFIFHRKKTTFSVLCRHPKDHLFNSDNHLCPCICIF